MKLLVDRGVVKCGHNGIVRNQASQHFVTIKHMPVLVSDDPVGRNIIACPNYGIGRKPCTKTMVVRVGYSRFLSINGHAVCLETVEGVTDGVDVQVVLYTVRAPGQTLVGAAS